MLANRGAEVLQVWGTGTQMRDFIHIEDCVDGIFTTMDQIDDAGAVNLSTGIFTSFIEFAQLAAELAGYRPLVKGMSDKPAGVHARGGDTTKQRALGFQAKLDFRAGVQRCAQVLLREVGIRRSQSRNGRERTQRAHRRFVALAPFCGCGSRVLGHSRH